MNYHIWDIALSKLAGSSLGMRSFMSIFRAMSFLVKEKKSRVITENEKSYRIRQCPTGGWILVVGTKGILSA